MGNVHGIDVSEHNGTLDWKKIKASGIRFAIIRTGYGVSHEDIQFQANMTGALEQNLPVGVYHFSYALNVEGAKREAAFVLKLLEPYKGNISLPVFFDFEYDTIDYAARQGVTLGRQAFNDHAVAFLEAIQSAGYTPGIYYNLDYKTRFVDASRLGNYVQWYAQYNSTASWDGYDIWQRSSTHKITGLSGTFDLNVAREQLMLTSNMPPASGTAPVSGTWKNGSTAEPVYADTGKKSKIGSLNPYETCDCLGTVGGMYIVKYKVDGSSTYKVGLVTYHGGYA